MSIRIYNSLSRRKETFEPVNPPKVGMYVCGPTVYMPSHIGHGVGPVIFDTIKRYLVFRGYEVTMVINITDVDDKLIDRAKERNITVKDLAGDVEDDYQKNLKRLNVTGVDQFPRATEYVPQIIDLVQTLIDKGHAYESGGDVYFDVSSFPGYGKLSGRNVEELEAGARIAPGEHKRHPADFALWKASKPGEPMWESPWGKGRPGWHIECSAMNLAVLGETVDIHGGGVDLIFPHHENEVAQSEAATGKPFAKYWMHNGLMQFGGDKMSKSKGNLVTMTLLLNKHDGEPDLIRFLLLSTHYRRPIDFSDEHIAEVNRGLQSFYRLFERFKRVSGKSAYKVTPKLLDDGETSDAAPVAAARVMQDAFLRAMDDDFNTAGAIAAMFEALPTVNRFMDERETPSADDAAAVERFIASLRFLGCRILGIFDEEPDKRAQLRTLASRTGFAVPDDYEPPNTDPSTDHLLLLLGDYDPPAELTTDEALIEWAKEERTKARQTKDFTRADDLRQRLLQANILLEDRPDGTTVWRTVT